MKKLFIISICFASLLSCQKIEVPICQQDEIKSSFDCNTRSGIDGKSNYFVTEEDVYMFLCGKERVNELIPYPSSVNTYFYAANLKDGGFILVSADKRAYPIIAYSKTGIFKSADDEVEYLINEYSAPIKIIASSQSLSEAMKYNVETWEYITQNKKTELNTKSSSMVYYYLIESEYVEYHSPSYGPLTSTAWGQGDKITNDYYWNKYCPFASSSLSGKRCPVGCVAVAGGQFAYYMKDRSGVHIGIPQEASCTGYSYDESNRNYSQSFSSNISYDYINQMPIDYNETNNSLIEHARIFLAYIGNKINMNYTHEGSGAYTSSLPNLFALWNLQSSYAGFSDSNVKSMIQNSTPVIVRGTSGESGHSWVIDGYRKTHTLRKNYYYISNVELTEEQINALTMDDWNNGYDEWEMPITTNYRMNWGWNGNCNGWYSSDNWAVAGYNFSDNKGMIICNQYE